MTSSSSPSPLTIPSKFRRNSLSASTSISMDNCMRYVDDAPPDSSSSFPSCAPLHLTRRNESMECQVGAYFDDPDGSSYNYQDETEVGTRSWSCHTLPTRSLPSLMRKFATNALQSEVPLSHGTSHFPYASRTTYFYPQGDNTIADDSEEYDLESMDIHIRETYFATSAERGRWLSSPIAPRVRSQAIPPMRGHSSPIKSTADASPRRERRRKMGCSVDEQILAPLSEDRDADVRYSSPLPPSSPLTSPMSDLSFLNDCDGDSVLDTLSSLDDCHSLTGTPALSISSTTCTSPIEPTRTPTPHDVRTVVSKLHSTDFLCHPAHSVISRRMSSCSPVPIDLQIHAPAAADREPDDILSPLSQFELDLPEAGLLLSDTVNKPYPGRHPVASEAACSQGERPSIQSLSVSSNCDSLDALLDTVGGSSSRKKAGRRGSAAGNAGARRTGKCRFGSSPCGDKKRRGTESRSPNHSEPPGKKSKLSHRRNHFEGRGTKSHPRKVSKVETLSRSHSCGAVGVLESIGSRHRKIPDPTRRAQQPTLSRSTTPISMDTIDAEFHASLTGMLIEGFATSRATSMDASALYRVLTQAHPDLTTSRPKGGLLMDIAAVLEAGRTRCGMFEKVDGSGARTRHQALESRWFYVPERDDDRERASLISALMPRQKRSETKKYKQYYYRPLGKMSRWDPEDAP